jgi:hypothetical protein
VKRSGKQKKNPGTLATSRQPGQAENRTATETKNTASSKKYGHLVVRKVPTAEEEHALAVRKAGSSGLNYSFPTAMSIGCNLAYARLPWGQAIDLSLAEAQLLAADTFLLHPDEHTVVISLVTVLGTTKQQERTYYCVSPLWLWELCGSRSRYHQEVKRITREV